MAVKKLKIAVLISGRGSNLQALIDACADEDFPAEIVLVFSNKPTAKGLERAADAGLATEALDHKSFKSREAFDAEVSRIIKQSGAELICLAGYMRLLSEDFVKDWRNKLINIHPAILPAFKGIHVHERALELGVRITGATVHFVRVGTDEGPIIIQGAVPVLSEDTPETLEARVLTVEHQIYPEAVRLIATGKVRVVSERVQISGDAGASVEPIIVPEPKNGLR